MNLKYNSLKLENEAFKAPSVLSPASFSGLSLFLSGFKERVGDCRLVQSFQWTVTKLTVDTFVLGIKNTLLEVTEFLWTKIESQLYVKMCFNMDFSLYFNLFSLVCLY